MRRQILTALTAALICTAGYAFGQAPEATIVPVDLSTERPIIDVFINGDGPFKFVVDTGASKTMVSADLAERLRLPNAGSILVGAPNSFTSIRAPIHRIRELRIKDLKFFGVGAVGIMDRDLMRHIRADGIISAQDFSGYLVTFDYRQRQLVVQPGSLPEPDDIHVMGYEERNGIAGVKIDVAGTPTFFHLDTGSPFFIALPGTMLGKSAFESEPQPVGMARTVVAEFLVLSGKLSGDIKVAKTTLSKPTVEILDKMPYGNLGFRFFRDFRVTFDYANERVRIVYWRDAL